MTSLFGCGKVKPNLEKGGDKMRVSLKAARINAGYTQKQAADLVGVTPSTIIKWESGKTFPKADKFAELCKIYKADFNDIFLPVRFD